MDDFEESCSFCESLKAEYLAQNNLHNGVRGSSFLVTIIIVVLGRNHVVLKLECVKYCATMKKWMRGIGIGLWIF